MSKLTQSAEKIFKRVNKQTPVPDWFLPVSYILAGILGVVLVATLATSFIDSSANNKHTDVVSLGTVVTTSVPNSTTTVNTETNTTVIVNGTSISVDGVALATKAVTALFTGDFTEVPLYPGSLQPVVAKLWPDKRIEGPTQVLAASDGSFQITFVVDPDGSGAEFARDVTVTIIQTEQGWMYLP
jgi:hypothetical protein